MSDLYNDDSTRQLPAQPVITNQNTTMSFFRTHKWIALIILIIIAFLIYYFFIKNKSTDVSNITRV